VTPTGILSPASVHPARASFPSQQRRIADTRPDICPPGAHASVDGKATEAGIVVGNVYSFDMFQAERHTTESNFRADTKLELGDCGTIVPEVPK
jgi:hypothetical protein